MSPDAAKEWVSKRAKKFIDEELRHVAVEDLGRYGHIYHTPAAKENYKRFCRDAKDIESAECAGFADRVFGFLKGKDGVPDGQSPSVVQVGLLPKDASYGHNIVLVNAALKGQDREISLDPLPPGSANWVVVDGWRAGLGWDYDECVFVINRKFVKAWGSRMQIIMGWNPDIPAAITQGQTRLKSTGLKLW